MRFDIDIRGDEDLVDELDQLGEKAKDLRPAFNRVLKIIVARYRRRFGGGGQWAPLSPATVERKSRQGLDPRVMRASGALERALTSPGRTSGRTQSVGKSTVRVGVGKRLFYARFQHFGTDHIPARPLFGWEFADRKAAINVLDDYIFGGGRL